jgi:hypothetical protein
MIRFQLAAMILISVLSWSNSQAETVSPQSIGSVIDKAQKESMNALFGKLQELSVQQNSERDFYAAIFRFKADDSRLSGFAKDRKPPRIVKIANGINISGLEGNPITVRLGRDLGTVEISGMTDKGSGKKSASRLKSLNDVLLALLPSANAGLWDWIFTRGAVRLFEVGFDIIDEGSDGYRLYTNAERAALFAKGAAHLTAEGAIVGCVVGLHGSENGSKIDDCKTGAGVGAAAAASVSAVGGGLAVGIRALEKGTAKAVSAYYLLPEAKQLALQRATSYVGKVGVAAALAHGADSLVKSDGVKLSCQYDDGRFELNDLSVTDKDRFLLRANGYSVSWGTEKLSNRSPEGIADYLKMHEDYKLLQPDARQLLAKSVISDLDRYSKICKEHGRGYTEVFRLEFDKPAVEVSKEPAKPSKSVK